MDSTTGSILIIDDDKELCRLLSEYLSPEGFQVEEAHGGEQGISMALNKKYSLVVLDVMLPGDVNGFNVLQCIRARSATLPVLMLSARGEDVDRIIGLEMGADDYLAKPFHPRELLARIHSILRRTGRHGREIAPLDTTARYFVGDLRLDCGSRRAYCSEVPIELTSLEFSILEILVSNAGRVVTRDRLANDVLNRALSPFDRSVDVHISRLRKKLGDYHFGTQRIKSVRGTGYIYTVPATDRE